MAVQLRVMDNAGVDRAVLSGGGENLEECRIINNEIYKWVKEKPERFIGAAHTIPTGGEEALDELDRAVKDLGFKGCVMRATESSVNKETGKEERIMLNSPDLHSFYKKVTKLDIPLYIHPDGGALLPNALSEPLRTTLRTVPHFASGCGYEMSLVIATKILVDGGVLEKFPNLKAVVGHLGGGISATMARLWTSRATLKAYGVTAEESIKRFRKIYFGTAGIIADIDTLKFALTKISPSRIVFATDYPYLNSEEQKRYIQDIMNLDISDKDKQLILEGNAATLLKIA